MSINNLETLAAECTSLIESVQVITQKVQKGKSIGTTDCIRFGADVQVEEMLREASVRLAGPAGLLRLVPAPSLLIGSPVQALAAVIHSMMLGNTWHGFRFRCVNGSPSSSPRSTGPVTFTPELSFPSILPGDWNSKGDETFRFVYEVCREDSWPTPAVLAEHALRPSSSSNPFYTPRLELKLRSSKNSLKLKVCVQDSTGESVEDKLALKQFITDNASQVSFPDLTHPFVEPLHGSSEPGWEDVGGIIKNVASLQSQLSGSLQPVLAATFPDRLASAKVASSPSAPPPAALAGLRVPPSVRPPGPGFYDPRQPPGAQSGGLGGPGGFGDDLLPGGGLGTGGMLFGPGNPRFDGGFGGRAPRGFGGRAPRGFGGRGPAPGVPPGARFDPYGPNIGGGGFGFPRPDHLRPPDDDFDGSGW